jgi:hypothetical protein
MGDAVRERFTPRTSLPPDAGIAWGRSNAVWHAFGASVYASDRSACRRALRSDVVETAEPGAPIDAKTMVCGPCAAEWCMGYRTR